MTGSTELAFLAEIALLLFVGRGLGELMQRFGQPAVIGQLLAGLILGPSLFGWVWPAAHDVIFPAKGAVKDLIGGLSDIGVLLLLLLTGMEVDLPLVRKAGKPAFAVAGMGIVIPFTCGFVLGEFLPDSLLPNPGQRLVASLFLGTALSISSIKIVAMVVREMNFMRRNLGQIIVASAIMEDTTGWIIISLTLGIAGTGSVELGSIARNLAGIALFLVLSYTIGRRLVFWLIRWVNDTFVSEYAVVTAILIVMCIMALITQAIGVNTVLGAFVAGVLVGQSPIRSQHIEDQLRGFITAFMMPIFFGLSGLSADLTILKDWHLALLTLSFIAVASIGKFGGAFMGGVVSRLSLRELLALGCGMNARGSTEVIIATIGLGMGALTQNLYTTIVTMAILTTMVMPPSLRWALRRLPMRREERIRLEKEELDEKGFVSQWERLLVVADDSLNGKFALRLAGFIAGHRGKPMTVIDRAAGKGAEGAKPKPKLKEVAADSAESGNAAAQEVQAERPERVEVLMRVESKTEAAVAAEAKKGYDFLFVGLKAMRDPNGSFSAELQRIASEFAGPLALVMAGNRADAVEKDGFTILFPVNGTEAARRGAEVALALSEPRDSRVRALHVAARASAGSEASARRKATKAVLRDVSSLGRRYGYGKVEVSSQTRAAPEKAILDAAESAETDLIVIGAQRRVGEALYLGETVDGVLRRWRGAIVLVVT